MLNCITLWTLWVLRTAERWKRLTLRVLRTAERFALVTLDAEGFARLALRALNAGNA